MGAHLDRHAAHQASRVMFPKTKLQQCGFRTRGACGKVRILFPRSLVVSHDLHRLESNASKGRPFSAHVSHPRSWAERRWTPSSHWLPPVSFRTAGQLFHAVREPTATRLSAQGAKYI
nr:hypothetical protein CFP56_38737 [Quercus suber]